MLSCCEMYMFACTDYIEVGGICCEKYVFACGDYGRSYSLRGMCYLLQIYIFYSAMYMFFL